VTARPLAAATLSKLVTVSINVVDALKTALCNTVRRYTEPSPRPSRRLFMPRPPAMMSCTAAKRVYSSWCRLRMLPQPSSMLAPTPPYASLVIGRVNLTLAAVSR
jgi:hypothetical protein